MFGLFKKANNTAPQKANFEEIKKRSKILVIDNDPFEYEPLFEKDGYSITKWTTNDDIDQGKIDSCYYDIILLDIDGVATDRSDKHGFGLLEYIKNKYPAQIIIVYSSKSYDMADHKYISLADDFLKKSSDYYDFKKIVDRFLEDHTDIAYYLSLIKSLIPADKQTSNLDNIVKGAITSSNSETLIRYLEQINLAGDLIDKIVKVIPIASKFMEAIK